MSKATGLNGLRLTVQAIMQMLRKKADADKVVSSVNGQTGDVALDTNILTDANGVQYKLTVGTDGTLSAVKVE